MKPNFLTCNQEDFKIEVSNVQHDIKFRPDEEQAQWLYTLEIHEKEYYTEEEFLRLCKMAVYIKVASKKKGKKYPHWVKDKRLWMEPAYVDEFCSCFDILNAYQAEYDHNVFIPRGAFEVM